jgi:hypothetical protein
MPGSQHTANREGQQQKRRDDGTEPRQAAGNQRTGKGHQDDRNDHHPLHHTPCTRLNAEAMLRDEGNQQCDQAEHADRDQQAGRSAVAAIDEQGA